MVVSNIDSFLSQPLRSPTVLVLLGRRRFFVGEISLGRNSFG